MNTLKNACVCAFGAFSLVALSGCAAEIGHWQWNRHYLDKAVAKTTPPELGGACVTLVADRDNYGFYRMPYDGAASIKHAGGYFEFSYADLVVPVIHGLQRQWELDAVDGNGNAACTVVHVSLENIAYSVVGQGLGFFSAAVCVKMKLTGLNGGKPAAGSGIFEGSAWGGRNPLWFPGGRSEEGRVNQAAYYAMAQAMAEGVQTIMTGRPYSKKAGGSYSYLPYCLFKYDLQQAKLGDSSPSD